MESFLLVVAIVLLVLDLDERRNAPSGRSDSAVEQEAEAEVGRIRQVTDEAVVTMMNEVRRSQSKQL